MKIKITQKGVFNAKGDEIEVGTEMTVKGDEIPKFLVGKGVVVSQPAKAATAVTNIDKLVGGADV